MRYPTLAEVLMLHRLIIERTGGSTGIRDLGALESAIAQPQMTFADADLYPSLAEKAAALCFSVVTNHPFVDGNKRVAHAAMETMLMLNGWEVNASTNEQEDLMLTLAAGRTSRQELVDWLRARIVPVKRHGGTG
jgi:death-on-curing protein